MTSVTKLQPKPAAQSSSGFGNLTEKEKAVIVRQFFPKGTNIEEIEYCFSVAKQLDLNPLMREIMFVPRRQKINGQWVEKYEPLIGRDGFLSIAHKTGQFAGIKTESFLKEIPVLSKNGWEYKKELVARCTVYRKDSRQPFVVEVSFNEYAQRTKEGYLTTFWKNKPDTMLKKVAESQCLRKAFNINGIYGAEEIGYGTYDAEGAVIRDPEAEESREEPETPKEEKEEKEEVEPADKAQLLEYLSKVGFTVKHGKHDPDRIYVRGNAYGKPQVKRILDKYFLHVKEDIYQLL